MRVVCCPSSGGRRHGFTSYDAPNRLTEIRQPFGSTGTNAITLYGYECGKKPLFYKEGVVLQDAIL